MMTEPWPGPWVEPWKRLATASALDVWRRRGAPDRSSFFFSWGGPVPGDDESGTSEFALIRGRDSGQANHNRIRDGRHRSHRGQGFNPDLLIASDRDDAEWTDDRLSASSALHDKTKSQSDGDRFIDPLTASFVTLCLKGQFRITEVRLGDVVTVWNPRNDLYAHAIVGDSSKADGATPSPHLVGVLGLEYGDEAVYLIHPESGRGQGVIPSVAEVDKKGERLLFESPNESGIPWAAIVAQFLRWRLSAS